MPVAVKPQKLIHLQNYLTHSDWDTIGSPDASYIAKLNCVAQRWRSLGIRSLHEQTAKHGVAILLCHVAKLPDHTLINQMAQDLKSTFMSTTCEGIDALPYVKEFPENHTQLPSELAEAAYHGKMPSPKQLEQIKPILKHIALRFTSKLLREKAAQTPSASSQPDQGHVSFGSGSNAMQAEAMCGMMMQMPNFFQSMKEHMGYMQGNGSQPMASPTVSSSIKLSPGKQKQALEDFQPKPRQAALALEDKHAATQPPEPQVRLPVECQQHNDEHLGTSAEYYENATFDALKARASDKKKEKGTKAQGKKDAQVTKKNGKEKKPKAKAKAPLKRPAAAMGPSEHGHGQASGNAGSTQYILPDLEKQDLEVARNVYVSRHYSKARVHARIHLKMSEDDAKEYGRKFLKQAGATWDAAKKRLGGH